MSAAAPAGDAEFDTSKATGFEAGAPASARGASSTRRFRPEISFCPLESPFERRLTESVIDSDAHAVAWATCAATAELLRAIYLL